MHFLNATLEIFSTVSVSIVNDEDESSNIIPYCLSVFSGPILAIGIASIYCLIPYHNVLEEPCYWYEFQIAVTVAFYPLLAWTVHPIMTKYFANLKMIQSNFASIFLCFVGCGTYLAVIAIYYYDWKDLPHPMPMNFYFGTSATIVVMTLATLVM